ncbi:hypothetical protein CPB84DRAFT_1847743 [Gymnopilus junonius]|uniref:Uncharacterized protein n=1 Tax=Gymnopilus junonius TaxID=109634 RepID=A0A9P5NPI0_GYMJU|nr:hypothetical protein CPB84DRAFT_1847743 [Gymnopilus junonius]
MHYFRHTPTKPRVQTLTLHPLRVTKPLSNTREYQNIKLYKMHGRAHNEPNAVTDQESILKPHVGAEELQHLGKLALFCAACPQPGINLPDNWKEDTNRILYCQSFIADGNFKANHLVPRNVEDDVHLTDGEAFMTRQADYSEHLKEAISLAPHYA